MMMTTQMFLQFCAGAPFEDRTQLRQPQWDADISPIGSRVDVSHITSGMPGNLLDVPY